MKRAFLNLIFLLILTSPAFSKDIIVTPTAPHNGSGTLTSPMSLWRAIGMVNSTGSLQLTNPSGIVAPGDHIKLRAGTYTYTLPYEPLSGNKILATWQAFNQGTSTSPIVIEPYGDGAVIIDGNLSRNPSVPAMHRNFTIWRFDGLSRYTYLINVKIVNSDPTRRVLTTSPPSCPPWSADESNRCDRRGEGYNDAGIGNRGIHLVALNAGAGFTVDEKSSGLEWSLGSLNGWDALDRLHGHGLYVQSDGTQGQKVINDNVAFGNLVNELNARGSGAASIQNVLFLRNAFYSGRVLISGPPDINIIVSALYGFQQGQSYCLEIGETTFGNRGIVVQDSYLFNRDVRGDKQAHGLALNFLEDVTVQRNSIYADASVALRRSSSNPPVSNFRFSNNSYNRENPASLVMTYLDSVGKTFPQWRAIGATFDNSGSSFNDPSTFPSTVFGRVSPWLPGYSYIVVFNPAGAPTATITAGFLQQLGYVAGQTLIVRNVQDYDRDVMTFGWNGANLTIDMRPTTRTQALPLGMSTTSMLHASQYADYANSFPYFGVFIIQPQGLSQTPTPPPTHNGD
jgi:hypothetical protein